MLLIKFPQPKATPTRQIVETLMPIPKRKCAVCFQDFELKPDKPGLATHCPECTAAEEDAAAERAAAAKGSMSAEERATQTAMDAERRKAIRDLLYTKDS
jgi:hypothetical protein